MVKLPQKHLLFALFFFGFFFQTSLVSANTPQLVKDIYSGTSSSTPYYLTAYPAEGAVFFQANTSAFGNELWKSDGTEVGTVQVADIRSGTSGSQPRCFVIGADGALYFTVVSSYGSYFERYESGSLSMFGSYLNVGFVNLLPKQCFIALNNGVMYQATTTPNQIFVSPFNQYSSSNIFSFDDSSFVSRSIVPVNGEGIFFIYDRSGTSSYDNKKGLWYLDFNYSSDSIKQKQLTTLSSTDQDLMVVVPNASNGGNSDFALFINNDLDHGKELWRVPTIYSEDMSAELLVDLNVGSLGSDISNLTYVPFLERYLFSAYDGTNYYAWFSDGTLEGTQRLSDRYPTLGVFNSGRTIVGEDRVYLVGNGGLWYIDSIEVGPVFVGNITPSKFDFIAGDSVFFEYDDGEHGEELWVTDGTESGTRMVDDIVEGITGTGLFYDFTLIGDELYFVIPSSLVGGTGNGTLYMTDVSGNGVNQVKTGLIYSAPSFGDEYYFLAKMGYKLFFIVNDASYGKELWIIDDTPVPVVSGLSEDSVYKNYEDNYNLEITGSNFGETIGDFASVWIKNSIDLFNLIPTFWSNTKIIAHFASMDLVEGVYNIYVNRSDSSSVSSFLSNALTVLSDDTAPVAASNLLVTSNVSDAQPNFSWTAASDSEAGLATNPYEISWSQASDFSAAVIRRTSSTSYELSESDALTTNGVWYVRVRALDKVGNWSDYVSTQFVFDNTAPVFSSSLTVDSPTSESLQTWSWGAATDNLSTVSYAWRMTDSANSEVGSGTLTDTEQYASNLTEGTWHFYLKAIDGYGNESAEQTATLVVDLSAPAIIADFSAQGAISDPEGDMVADSTPTLEWTAAVDASDLADPAYDLRFGTSSSYASSSALTTTNELSYQIPETLADGVYYFWVSATDVLGHKSESRSLKLYVDTTAPAVPVFDASTVPLYTKNTMWTISWPIPTDVTLGGKAFSFRLERSRDQNFSSGPIGASIITQSSPGSDPIFFTENIYDDGTYYYRLRASDAVGNTSDWSETTFVLLDRTAPTTPSGVAFQEGAASSETRPTLQWDANQEDTLTYTVAWSQSATFSDSVQTAERTESNFRPSSALTEGQWYFRVRSTDLAGNQSAWSNTASILIDTTAPTAPGLPSTTSPTNQSSQQWLWTAASDANSFSYTWRITDAEGNETSAGTTSDTELTTELSEGTWYFYIKTIDVAGNQSQERSGIVQVDFTDPEAAAIAATATNNSVRFSWLSPELTSAKVSYGYGINGNLEWSVEDLTAKEGNQYLDADSLAACSQYYYRLQLTDLAGNQRTSGFYSFQTEGCLGDASIVESHSGEVIREASASVSLAGDTGTLTLEVPAEVSSQSSLLIHINKINTQDVVSAAPTTTGSAIANGQTYDIKALLDGVTEVTQFDHPITLVLSYADSILTGMKEETLRLKWWSGTAWEELDNCQLDTGVKTLTCQTSHFSTFAVIGELNPVTPTPAPGGTGSSESSGGSSSGGGSGSSVCNATRPSGAADLFQINRTGSVADLYVSPAGNPYTRYMVAYGSNLRTDQYTAFFDYRNASGVMVFEIADLDPNSQYTFKVQVLNECQFGDWSNSLTIARARANSQQIFYKGFTSQLNLKATAAVSTLTNIFYRRPVETSPTEPAPIQNTLPTDSQSQVTGPAVQETQGSAQQPLAPVVNNSATQVGAKSFSSKVSNWVRSLFSF
jgi:ELWxxDGT repeat protein